MQNKIEVLSNVKGTDFPSEWYDLCDEDHFWFEWRLKAFLGLLHDLNVSKDLLHVMDIGSGAGGLADSLEKATSWTIDRVDVNRPALERARTGRGRSLLYDISDRKSELVGSYDALLLFDVLEHVEDPARFLDHALEHLRAGGFVFLNVPALQSLFSSYDQAAGHFVRYSKATLKKALEPLRGQVDFLDFRYWGFSLIGLAAARKLMLSFYRNPGRDLGRDSGAVIRLGFKPPHPVVNQALRSLLRLETRLIHRAPLGTSLLAALRKKAPEA